MGYIARLFWVFVPCAIFFAACTKEIKIDASSDASLRKSLINMSRGMSENEYNGLSMVERSIAATAAKGTEECGFEVDMNRSTDLMGAPGHVFFNTTQFFSYGLDTYVAENKFTERYELENAL